MAAGGGGPAGQLHRGPAAGPERALLLVLVAVAPVVTAQLADRAGEAAQPGEAAAGAGLPAEAAGRSGRGEAEEGEGVGAEGAAALRQRVHGAPAGETAPRLPPTSFSTSGSKFSGSGDHFMPE